MRLVLNTKSGVASPLKSATTALAARVNVLSAPVVPRFADDSEMARNQAADVRNAVLGRAAVVILSCGAGAVVNRSSLLENEQRISPFGLTVPLSVAEKLATFVAGLVVTTGGSFGGVGVGVALITITWPPS